MSTLRALAWLLAFHGLGELLARLTGLPIPGPVVGMACLTVALTRGWLSAEVVAPAARPLLRHMSFLFVPPGVGLMLYFDEVGAQPLAILTSVVVSTLLVLSVTGWVYQRLSGAR